MSNNSNLEEVLLLCEVLGVYYSPENKIQIEKLTGTSNSLVQFLGLKEILNELPPGKSLHQHRSVLDQAIFELLSKPFVKVFPFLFGVLNRIRIQKTKSWNSKPGRAEILEELNELAQNYLVSAFVTPEMFPEASFEMKIDLFANFNSVLTHKKQARSRMTIKRLQMIKSTLQINQKAVTFLNLISMISNQILLIDLFSQCKDQIPNFAEVLLAVLMVELQFSSLYDGKADRIIGILMNVLQLPEVKAQFLLEIAFCCSLESGKALEFGCVLGALCSLSLVYNQDLSDLQDIKIRIEDRLMGLKSKSGYFNFIKVIF